jgi:hypothetical protein
MGRAKQDLEGGPRLGLAEVGRVRPPSPSPDEGRRLVVAFMGIKNAALRDALINLVERMSGTYNDLK